MEKKEKPKDYLQAVGRRKTSVAQVRLLMKGDKAIIVNDKSFKEYFPTKELQEIILDAFDKMEIIDKFGVSIKVRGGGIHSQAEAIRHGIARTLVELDPEFRKKLRRVGYLTRDPRMRERKKFGLKRARKAPQWAKR